MNEKIITEIKRKLLEFQRKLPDFNDRNCPRCGSKMVEENESINYVGLICPNCGKRKVVRRKEVYGF